MKMVQQPYIATAELSISQGLHGKVSAPEMIDAVVQPSAHTLLPLLYSSTPLARIMPSRPKSFSKRNVAMQKQPSPSKTPLLLRNFPHKCRSSKESNPQINRQKEHNTLLNKIKSSRAAVNSIYFYNLIHLSESSRSLQ